MRRKAYAAYVCMALLLLSGAAVMQGCLRDREMDIDAPGDGAVSLRLEVDVEGGLHEAATRGMSDTQEAAVATIDVYHFVKLNGTTYQAVTMVPVQGTFTEGPPSWVNTTLNAYPGRDSKLVIVMNARRADNYGYTKMQSLTSFLNGLVMTETGEWYNGTSRPLPMYAVTGAVEVKKDLPNNEITDNGGAFPLIRMHAKFNVRLKSPLDFGTFELVSACVFNRKTQGYIPYIDGDLNYADPAKPKAMTPNVPSTTATAYLPGIAAPYYTAGTNSMNPDYGMIVNKQYVFEVNQSGESDRLKKTALVVGGRFGSDTNVSYYRVDVPPTVTNGNILRNRLYDVEIQGVLGTGYDTAEEAFVGAKQIEYTVNVKPWGLNYEHSLPWIEPEASSNCYILPTGGETIAIPVYGQIKQAVAAGDLPADWINNDMKFSAELVWAENANNIKWFKAYDGSTLDHATLHVTPGSVEGNAVIAVFNDKNSNHIREAGEDILWSWHIWVLDPNNQPGDINGSGTIVWMDRDMGALLSASEWPNAGLIDASTTPAGSGLIGMGYQWGRKDPISTSLYKRATYTASGSTFSFPAISTNTRAAGINNPGNPITNYTVRQSNWDQNKTVYDPCPKGWRVPTKAELETTIAGAVRNPWYNTTSIGYMSAAHYGGSPYCWHMFYHGCSPGSRLASRLNWSVFYNVTEEAFVTPLHANGYADVRCVRDGSSSGAFTPTLTTDSDGRKILMNGSTYTIAVTSNTEWEASIRRGTNEVTVGDASLIGLPLLNDLSGFDGGSVSAYVYGNGNGTMTVKTIDHETSGKEGKGSFTTVFRDKATGEILNETTITGLSYELHYVDPEIRTEGNVPSLTTTYIGAFWRADQRAERIITVPTGGTASYWGKWAVQVLDYGPDFEEGDILFAAGSPNAANLGDPDTEGLYVPGTSVFQMGSVTGQDIVFRIGLKQNWTPTAAKPARYARIVVSFGTNGSTEYYYKRVIWLRQGEGADYLIHPDDVAAGYGQYARKITPSNLTAAGMTDGHNYIQVYRRGTTTGGSAASTFTAYPTQAGAHWQWAGDATHERFAFHPGKTTVTGWSQSYNTTLSWESIFSDHEACPPGYRRFKDDADYWNGETGTSEFMRSLGCGEYHGLYQRPTNYNVAWGYYADGFFDRRAIVSDGVARGTWQAAYVGYMWHNNIPGSSHKNASVFFPAAGYRNDNNGTGNKLYSVGASCLQWTSTFPNSGYNTLGTQVYFMSSGMITQNSNDRWNGNTIRCVAE